MKKILFAAILSLFLGLSFTTSAVFSQKNDQLKIGVVDIEVILKEMPEAIDADKKLKEMGTKWQDTLMNMKKDFDDRIQKYQKQKSLMSADQQQKEEEALQNLNAQMMQYQDAKFGQTGELSVTREKYLDPIRSKVRAAIQKVSKDEKISLVLDKGSSTVLYFDDKFDLTYKVLDVIKRGSN